MLPNVKGRGQPPITSYGFHTVIDQACGSSVETPELEVKSLHPPAVLSMGLIHHDPDSITDLLRNILEERGKVWLLWLRVQEEEASEV